MNEDKNIYEKIIKLVKENPNDYVLGQAVRKLINQIEDSKK
jgi:hypothetical protein